MHWLGDIPRIRDERHYVHRVDRCFVERPRNLPQMLADAVSRKAGGEAIVCGRVRIDYRTLDELAGQVAAGLAARGIGPGDRVALLLPNGTAHVVAWHAILRLGAIVVPLNIREERPELAFVIGHSGAKVLLFDGGLAPRIPSPADVPALAHRIEIGAAEAWPFGFDEIVRKDTALPAEIAEEETAAILYTSGTTGRPKGAMLTHMSIIHAVMIYEACMGLTEAERSVVSVPLSHVTGLTAGLALMARVAGTLIVMPTFKAEVFLELAARERMTHTVMVPAMYNLCLMQPQLDELDLSEWRIGGFGGAPMPEITIRQLAEKLPGLRLFNAYGSTETTGPVVLMPPDQMAVRRTAVGRAVPVAEIRVMDEDGREVPTGEAGEIWLRGPNVVPGYWENPEATREGLVAGYWRSGDIGVLDADGFLTLLDRAKDMINRGGFKIYSVEVENVLSSHPLVEEAAVVARPCPVLGERVHAVVVGSEEFDLARLRAHCVGKLADYKIPESLTLRAEPLPRNAGGKVLKRELRAAVT